MPLSVADTWTMETVILGSRRVGKLSLGLCRNGVWPSGSDIADRRVASEEGLEAEEGYIHGPGVVIN